MKTACPILVAITAFLLPLSAQESEEEDIPGADEIFAGYDLDGDGIIDRIEFGMSETAQVARENGREEQIAAVFNELDTDRDNAVSRKEFEVGMGYENKPASSVDADTARQFAEVDLDRDGLVDRREFGRTRFAQSAIEDEKHGLVNKIFEGSDEDRDGKLNQSEFSTSLRRAATMKGFGKDGDHHFDRLQARFSAFDTDGNGGINETELADSEFGDRMKQRAGPDMVRNLFERLDQDNSSEIEMAEFDGTLLASGHPIRPDKMGRKGKGKGKGKSKGSR